MPKDNAWDERDLYEEQKEIEAQATLRGVRRAAQVLENARDKEREAVNAEVILTHHWR